MFKNKENIIIALLIVLILGNTFMSYRNFMIAREADRYALSEATFLRQNASAWSAVYDWAQGCAAIGVCPSTVQIQTKLDELKAQTKK